MRPRSGVHAAATVSWVEACARAQHPKVFYNLPLRGLRRVRWPSSSLKARATCLPPAAGLLRAHQHPIPTTPPKPRPQPSLRPSLLGTLGPSGPAPCRHQGLCCRRHRRRRHRRRRHRRRCHHPPHDHPRRHHPVTSTATPPPSPPPLSPPPWPPPHSPLPLSPPPPSPPPSRHHTRRLRHHHSPHQPLPSPPSPSPPPPPVARRPRRRPAALAWRMYMNMYHVVVCTYRFE